MSDAEPPEPRPRRGRRPGPGSSRDVILAAARSRFAADGFTDATIRAIAADAGVDASQVMQFFGSKERLFAAVMALPATALDRFASAFEGPVDQLGERVVREFFRAWEGPADESEPLMATLRGAIVNEQASAALSGFIESRLLAGVHGGAPDAPLRAGLASAALVGVVTSRRIIGVPSIAAADTEELVRTLAPAIQALLVGGDESAARP